MGILFMGIPNLIIYENPIYGNPIIESKLLSNFPNIVT